FLSVLGVGYGNYKDNKLETLADKGNGNYAYIDSIFEAKKALVDEMGANMTVVAKDVKLQVEFNPEQVKGYRLIGYENRVMDAQDFADDTKDGGEMGAGHSVTALYEIIPVDSDMEIPEIQFKYDGNKKQEEVENKTSFADELFTVNIRYKEPDGDKSKLESYPCSNTCYNKEGSDNLRWAAAVAAFGMILKESAYCGKADIDMVLKLARSARNDNMDIEYQDEFIELVGSMYQVNLLGID
ncbi:MAG: YfbK domain-containing protein, partial [Wujia sp.]